MQRLILIVPLLVASVVVVGFVSACPPTVQSCDATANDCPTGTACTELDDKTFACTPVLGEGEGAAGEGEGAAAEGEGAAAGEGEGAAAGEGEGEGEGVTIDAALLPAVVPVDVGFNLSFATHDDPATCVLTIDGAASDAERSGNAFVNVKLTATEAPSELTVSCSGGPPDTVDLQAFEIVSLSVGAGEVLSAVVNGVDATEISCDLTLLTDSAKPDDHVTSTVSVPEGRAIPVVESSKITDISCADINQIDLEANLPEFTLPFPLPVIPGAGPVVFSVTGTGASATLHADLSDATGVPDNCAFVATAAPTVSLGTPTPRTQSGQTVFGVDLHAGDFSGSVTVEVECFDANGNVSPDADSTIVAHSGNATDSTSVGDLATGDVAAQLGNIGAIDPATFALADLAFVAGAVTVDCSGSAQLTTVSLASIEQITGNFSMNSCDGLQHLEMPALQSVGGSFLVANDVGIFCNEISPVVDALVTPCPTSISGIDGGGTACPGLTCP
ncbi:MAG TPA: hypothetical protein VGO62_21675 [Myxococcota bacterium]